MIENFLLTILVILMALLFILLIALFYLFIQKRSLNDKKQEPTNDLEKCSLHPQIQAESLCVICDEYFCKNCLKTIDGHTLCPTHLKLYSDTIWTEIRRVESNAQHPEEGVRLVEMKKSIWKEHQVPLYLETQYKIDVDHDQITSFLILYGDSQSKDLILSKLD